MAEDSRAEMNHWRDISAHFCDLLDSPSAELLLCFKKSGGEALSRSV